MVVVVLRGSEAIQIDEPPPTLSCSGQRHSLLHPNRPPSTTEPSTPGCLPQIPATQAEDYSFPYTISSTNRKDSSSDPHPSYWRSRWLTPPRRPYPRLYSPSGPKPNQVSAEGTPGSAKRRREVP